MDGLHKVRSSKLFPFRRELGLGESGNCKGEKECNANGEHRASVEKEIVAESDAG
jgi:hypothetical protein